MKTQNENTRELLLTLIRKRYYNSDETVRFLFDQLDDNSEKEEDVKCNPLKEEKLQGSEKIASEKWNTKKKLNANLVIAKEILDRSLKMYPIIEKNNKTLSSTLKREVNPNVFCKDPRPITLEITNEKLEELQKFGCDVPNLVDNIKIIKENKKLKKIKM